MALYLGDDSEMEELRTYDVYQTDMETSKSSLQRVVFSRDDGIAQAWAKRMNAFNRRNDFPFHYTVRERIKTA